MIGLQTEDRKDCGEDSTGKHIHIGSRVRFRGRNYTIRSFLPDEKMEFIEPCHTPEIPEETSVDRID